MKLQKKLAYTKLHSDGFAHLLPVLVFLVLFGAVGVLFIFRSDAATPKQWYIEDSFRPDSCLTDVSGVARLEACQGTKSNIEIVPKDGENYIEANGSCMQTGSTDSTALDLYFRTCRNVGSNLWNVTGTSTNVRLVYTSDATYCAGDGTPGAQLKVTACRESVDWYKVGR
jgi:hypothetical protein